MISAIALALTISLNLGTLEACEGFVEIANANPKSDAQLQRLRLMYEMCIEMLEADTNRDARIHCVTTYNDEGEPTTACNFFLKERGYENADEANNSSLGIDP